MIATGQQRRAAAISVPLARDKVLNGLGLGFALTLAAILNLWNLAQNGYSNTYYAAAVQSMTGSLSNFFYGAFDAGGFITVDKPPVALMIQAISARIFGFSGLAILIPEALAGVAAVALLYHLVRRIFGPLAGFIAAVALAITPVAVAIERTNNTDSWLLFFLLLAAWALVVATERARLGMLLLAMALVGVAFNVKMLAAWIVLPTFMLLYLVAAPLNWKKRLLHLTAATALVLAVSLSWATVVQLVPADQRPYIGGSDTNSALELAFGYNGLGRITGQGETNGGGGGNFNGGTRGDFTRPSDGSASTQAQSGDFTPPTSGELPAGMTQPGGTANGTSGGGGGISAGTPGLLRLFGEELGDQWSWFVPLAGFGVLGTALTVRRKLPLDKRGQALLLWGGWGLTYGVVFSTASGIFHPYYTVMLAPAVAALAGAGVASLVALYKKGGWQGWLLPAGLVATAAYEIYLVNTFSTWGNWLVPLLAGGTAIAVAPLLALRLFGNGLWRRVAPALVAVGLLALAIAPSAWAVTPVLAAGNSTIPTAGPSLLSGNSRNGNMGGNMGNSASSGLISYLEENQGDYFYLVAESSANQAGSIALETGEPVLAMGGFSGSDPAMTVEKLQELVSSGMLRYVLIGGNGGMGGGSSDVTQWITANGTVVDASLYGGSSNGALYDLSGAVN